MTTKTKKYDARGNEIVDDDDIVRDKQRIRVPLMLSDGRGMPPAQEQPTLLMPYLDRRPGSVNVEDAERERRRRMYADRDAKLSDAWREGAGYAEGDEQ